MEVLFQVQNEQVLLRADEFNYELCKIRRRTEKDTGETVDAWEPYKYFASLDQALDRIIDMKVRASDATTLAELKAVIEASRNEICRTWKTGVEKGA